MAGEGINHANGEPCTTGWEESRNEYERFLGKGLAVGDSYRASLKASELENVDSHHRGINDSIGLGGSVVRSAVYALSALSEDEEDPEERRKRMEAQENGEALGALIGLVAGAIAEIAEENEQKLE